MPNYERWCENCPHLDGMCSEPEVDALGWCQSFKDFFYPENYADLVRESIWDFTDSQYEAPSMRVLSYKLDMAKRNS